MRLSGASRTGVASRASDTRGPPAAVAVRFVILAGAVAGCAGAGGEGSMEPESGSRDARAAEVGSGGKTAGGGQGVCDRTPQIRDALAAATSRESCAGVTAQDLAGIHALTMFGPRIDPAASGIAALRSGDFQGLVELERLDIIGHPLATLPADVFAGLPKLEQLFLTRNRIMELPDGILEDLAALVFLGLSDNELATLPGGLFDGLTDLQSIDLDFNQLAALPPGLFGGLPGLLRLNLANNRLRALPDGFFQGANGLESLQLDYNPGAPFAMPLELERTDAPAQAPGPARVRATLAPGAPFDVNVRLAAIRGAVSSGSVRIPAGETASATVQAAGGTLAVEVAEAPAVPDTDCSGVPCFAGFEFVVGDPLVLDQPQSVLLTVSAVHLTQAAQSLEGSVPLVAGRRALLRVFATADSANALRVPARATFFRDGAAFHTVSLDAPDRIPRTVREGSLDRSFNALVPGSVLAPGVEMVVEIDPDSTISLTPGSTRRVPAEGRATLDVRGVRPLGVTLVPIQYVWEPNAATNGAVLSAAQAAAGDESGPSFRFVRSLLPVKDLNVTLREPYYTWADTSSAGVIGLLDELSLVWVIEAGGTGEYYHGLFAVPRFIRARSFWSLLGIAWQPGYIGLTVSNQSNGAVHPELGQTMAHEIGHNLNLGHAPCGGVGNTADPNFPHADGSTGVWGYEFEGPGRPSRMLSPAAYVDLLSYCRPYWISDYSFAKAFEYRRSLPAPPAATSAREPVLLLWGGARNGELRLEPPFVWEAPVKLPRVSGSYRLAGLDARGRELFSMAFAPDPIDHGGQGFVFAVPYRTEWDDALAAVTLSGPEGSASVDIAASRRMAIFTDRATGRIQSIARDWSGELPAGSALHDFQAAAAWPEGGRR